ncbi:hypothetical protein [Mesorhizobium sp. CO1-1-8]|uniref:hypothetical protein n=1 Tax=Mesorhizobium sp. CO1-1-8 TaxID=2876631 RepID=UPI001CD0D4D1|nr:hypothetical protein [Mesorhizobium sp. CO1-1-8]MBZ9772523.1 hypothetical protein [Mesorhizobium sp. CO1-1-8]
MSGHKTDDATTSQGSGPAAPEAGETLLWTDNAAVRRRMKGQATLMAFVALLVLLLALSVPFVLHYLHIVIP